MEVSLILLMYVGLVRIFLIGRFSKFFFFYIFKVIISTVRGSVVYSLMK